MANYQIKKAILRALVYADMFDYPLTEEEVGRWMIESKSKFKSKRKKEDQENQENQLNQVKRVLEKLVDKGEVVGRGERLCLKGREKVFQIREERERWSREKWKIARRVGRWLKIIPIVKMVAVTGTLAMNNCREDDDVDLMIITSPGWLWTTRAVVTGWLVVLGLRRRPGVEKAKGKVCANVWLSEGDLKVEPGGYVLYLAHEVLQAEPVVDKGGIYSEFLAENAWVKDWLPEAWKWRMDKNQESRIKNQGEFSSNLGSQQRLGGGESCLIEEVAFRLQKWYMRGKITREVVTRTRAMFHPEDVGERVMRRYRERILTEKVA
jgi:hypothetical protein